MISYLLLWMGIWLALTAFIPRGRLYKGHFWRTFRKTPGLRKIRPDTYLWITYWFAMVGVSIAIGIPVLNYLVDSARLVDDWLNHDDDDYRKKWERLKNKIQWRIFKPSPVKQPVTCHGGEG